MLQYFINNLDWGKCVEQSMKGKTDKKWNWYVTNYKKKSQFEHANGPQINLKKNVQRARENVIR